MDSIKDFLAKKIGEKHLIPKIFEMKRLMEYADFIVSWDNDWRSISMVAHSVGFVREYKDKLMWDIMGWNKDLSIEVIREFKDRIVWKEYHYSENLTNDFMIEFKDYVDWKYILFHLRISEEIIKIIPENILADSWYNISRFQTLSEEFMREYSDKINWTEISARQRLSEEFIREFEDRFYWDDIFRHQNISVGFALEFQEHNYYNN